MKKISIYFCALLLSCSVAYSQGSITLDGVTGLYSTDTLDISVPITFSIRLHNYSGNSIFGYTNGFRISSPDGATWTPVTGNYTEAISDSLMERRFINEFASGSVSDTIGFGGFKIFSSGITDGFNEIVWTINIGSLSALNYGKTICIDSTFYMPAGVWKWSSFTGNQQVEFFPTWDGPHCFTIFTDSLDTDSDGILDEDDNCILVYNPEQLDTDNDLVGDKCDLCEGFDDSLDADLDGIPDGCDNCVSTYNPTQADTNLDGVGDNCGEICCDPPGDFDGNNILDIVDLTATVDWMFRSGINAQCLVDADVDQNCIVDIGDLTGRINFMFNNGPELLCGCVK